VLADRAYNCQIVYIELFINEIGWLINDLNRVLIVSWSLVDLGPLGLDEDIYNTRDPCTSYASENIDYLTYIKPKEQFNTYT